MPAWDGNYSRDMFPSSRRKQYVRGRMQQGKEVADADRNDNTDLQYEKLRNFIQKLGGDAFFFEDAFLITADGSDNDIQIEPGSGFVAGHEAYLGLSARYVNLGIAQEDTNLHSISTALTDTILTDSAMQWGVNELVGRELYPDLSNGTSFTILSNTATEITVAAGLLAAADVGDSYYIGMSTPSGGSRTDTVWLNLYLDEIDPAEDPYLFHNLGSGIELDRRIKARTVIMVEQGAETYSDYTDLDGNNHYLVKLATINRFDGVDAINLVDVADFRDLTISAGGSVTVTPGDGTSGTLDDKISTITPVAKQIVDPGGDEQLQLYLSNPNNPNLFLAGTNPPTWAAPPSGGGGGGALSSLAGRTFAPLLTGPESVLSISGTPASLNTDEFYHYRLDLDAAYLIPDGATHAVLRIAHDGAINAGAGNVAVLSTYADAFDPDLGGKTAAVGKAGNDPNGFISVGNEVAEYAFAADAENRAGDTHYTTVYVELNPARVQDPLDSQFYDASVVVATGGTSGGTGNVPVSPVGVRVFLDGYLLQEDTPQGASGEPLVGKTFVPTPPEQRGIGQIYLHNGGPVSGDRSGTFDVINDGSGAPRFFPDNTTHLLLEGIVSDANPTSNFSGNLQLAPPGTVLPDEDYSTALVNGGGSGEGSLTSVAQIVLPYDPNDSNYEWYFDESLGGTYTFLGLSTRLVGYYIEEAGTAPNPVAFSATFKGVGDPQEGNIDIPTGTTSKVVFPETGQADLDFTSGQSFNETNWIFTAPVKGKYAFHASATTEHTGNNHGLTVSIHKNPTIAGGLLTASEEGVGGSTGDVESIGMRRTAAASGILDLEKFDTVIMAAVTDSVATETIDSAQFQGHLINSVGATTLEGKTYLPVDPTLREVANGTYSATTTQVENIDLSAEGITVPSNATHAIIRVQLDANGGSTPASDTHEAYAVPYAASPGPFDVNDRVVYSDNNSSENNTNSDSMIVPLNRPADPTADITVQINSTINTGAGAALNYNIWVDGFYIEESAVAVIQGTNALEGLTFVPDKRQLFTATVDSTNKSGYHDISNPPAGAKYAVVKFLAQADADPGTSWTWIASAGPGDQPPGTLDSAVVNQVGSGQMNGNTNQWHDIQGSTLVDVTAGAVLGRFQYSVWVTSGTIGVGTIGGPYVLEGWYIEDAGTDPSPFLGMRCIQQGLAHNTWALSQALTTGGTPPDTYEYDLADFVSTDPSFDISKVWGVWVAYVCDSDSADMRVRATWPDGALQDIGGQDQVGVGDDRSSRGVTMIPVNPGQPSITLQLTFTGAVLGGADSASFQIIGLQQYVTG